MSIRASDVSELDVVLLEDGREATVLEVFKEPGKPPDFLVEITDFEMMLLEVSLSQIEKVVWRMQAD